MEYFIPAPRSGLLVLLLSIWLSFWIYAGILIASDVFTIPRTAEPGVVLFLLFWAVALAAVLWGVFWQFVGVEVVALTSSSLVITRRVLFVSFTKSYDLKNVRKLSIASDPDFPSNSANPRFVGFPKVGGIAMLYSEKEVRFGCGVDEREAELIIGELQSRWPQRPDSAA